VATIFYGMSGEGRGHATRGRAIIEALRTQHRVTLFTSDCAYALLEPLYRHSEVRVVAIPGLHFHYAPSGQVDLVRTMAGALRFRLEVAGHVRAVLPEFERQAPDLVIADFEPILARAARACSIPFVSFDHQHYLVVSDLRALPRPLRNRAAIAGMFVRALYDWQAATIVSSFFTPALRPAFRDATTQVGVLIRQEFLHTRPENGAHLVAYMRRSATPATLAALGACGREVRVYGLGARAPEGRLRYLAIDEGRFLEDLATCHALVSTAGNQLVGEALYLRKPLLVLPEPRNFEQAINAFFLQQSGAGWAESSQLSPPRLGAFLEAVESLRARINPDQICGNQAALAALLRHLERPRMPPPPVPPPPKLPVTAELAGAPWA
jgi:uncharacterized protein (TIGR00661 family)